MALADILEQNAFSPGGITPAGLARLRQRMLAAGHVSKLRLNALKGERAPVLAGGLAIMSVAVAELRIDRIDAVGGALRLGVLYDLLGRTFDEDSRAVTVERFTERYGIDRAQASRVAKLAVCALSPRVTCAGFARGAARRMGGAAARAGDVGLAYGVSQARRVHPAERRHARVLRRRTGPARAARLRLPRPAREDRRLARPRRSSRRAAGAASRGALSPRAHDDRRAAHPDRNRAPHPHRDLRSAGSPRIR